MLNLDGILITKENRHVPFLRAAYKTAWVGSEDTTTKTGTILVKNKEIIGEGFNHFVPGHEDVAERFEKPLKYELIVHAEVDVLTKYSPGGIIMDGSILYCPWFSCIDCSKVIINSGIKDMIGHYEMMILTPKDWEDNLNKAMNMLKKSGVNLSLYQGKIGGVKSLFRDKIWEP